MGKREGEESASDFRRRKRIEDAERAEKLAAERAAPKKIEPKKPAPPKPTPQEAKSPSGSPAEKGGPDVRAIRTKLGMTQVAFARAFGFSLRTVQGWEREKWRAIPAGPAAILLRLIEADPEWVIKTLGPSASSRSP